MPKIVCVLPSTRTCTRAAAADGTSTQCRHERRREPAYQRILPSARGSSWRRTAGLLTRGALPCRLPSPEASGVSARKRLPSQRRDRPGFAPAFPNRSPCCARESSIVGVTDSRALTHWLPVVALGGADLRALVDPAPRHGARDVGPDPAQVRARRPSTRSSRFLLARALGREAPALALGVLYAVSDELHQAFVRGRHASPIDVAIDTVGLLLGLLAWRRLVQLTPRIRADGARRGRPTASSRRCSSASTG